MLNFLFLLISFLGFIAAIIFLIKELTRFRNVGNVKVKVVQAPPKKQEEIKKEDVEVPSEVKRLRDEQV